MVRRKQTKKLKKKRKKILKPAKRKRVKVKSKVKKKQKELNLDLKDENGVELFEKYKDYKNNISLIKEFANS